MLLVSTYELGHVPAGLSQPAAWLERAGLRVDTLDLSVEELDPRRVQGAARVAFSVPMHTATRLALPVIERVRAMRPEVPIAAYGLYAPPNAERLARAGATATFGGEVEPALVEWATRDARERPTVGAAMPVVARGKPPLLVGSRRALPGLERYARVLLPDGAERVVGYVEASRGCKHRCRHCPVVPIYDGRFRVVEVETVLEDVAAQVAAGAEHISFGDPDFLNGPGHARAVLEGLAARFPGLGFDVTAKVEHLLARPELVDLLEATGCLFVTTAVESVDDAILERLDKGHTAADFRALVGRLRGRRMALSPTFLPFTPWTTVAGYRELLATLAELDLVEHVAPVQLAIRLLVPAGSRLLELAELDGVLGPFDEEALAHPWRATDEVEALEADVRACVERAGDAERRAVFAEPWEIAHRHLGEEPPALAARVGAPIPRSSEPWYCCAEPACGGPAGDPS